MGRIEMTDSGSAIVFYCMGGGNRYFFSPALIGLIPWLYRPSGSFSPSTATDSPCGSAAGATPCSRCGGFADRRTLGDSHPRGPTWGIRPFRLVKKSSSACFAEKLAQLPEAGRGELKAIATSVGETAFCQIMADIELGRRVVQAQTDRQLPAKISDSDQALGFCREHFARLAADSAQEEFHVVCLDVKNQVLGTHQISVGSIDRSLVHPREVFRPAIKDAAKAVLLVHNHPSGDPTPSDDDLTLTTRLEEAGKTVGTQRFSGQVALLRHRLLPFG